MRYASISSITQITRNHSAILKCSRLWTVRSGQSRRTQDARTEPQATCLSQATKHTRKTGRRSGGSRLAQTARWRARTHSSHALDKEPLVVVAGELEGVELLADLPVVLEVQELDPVLQ